MRIQENIFRTIKTSVVAAVALVGVSVLLMGSVQFCLCDPDHCGHACHDCTAPHVTDVHGLFTESAPATDEPCACAEDEGCHHVVISVGDLFANSFVVSVPVGVVAPAAWLSRIVRVPQFWRPRPNSTAPPDSGGIYRATVSRLHPLS